MEKNTVHPVSIGAVSENPMLWRNVQGAALLMTDYAIIQSHHSIKEKQKQIIAVV